MPWAWLLNSTQYNKLKNHILFVGCVGLIIAKRREWDVNKLPQIRGREKRKNIKNHNVTV
jgi:hypothetical protein